MTEKTATVAMIEMGLDVTLDWADGLAADATEPVDARQQAERAGDELRRLNDLVASIGVATILASLRDAADVAADAHDGEPVAKNLHAFSKAITTALKTL